MTPIALSDLFYIIAQAKPTEGAQQHKGSVSNMEWLDMLSLFWYTTGIVFITGILLIIVTVVWLFLEFYRTLVIDEDSIPINKSINKQPPD